MAATHRAPKQWCLSKTETVNSFENWKQNLLYTLSLDKDFTEFLTDGAKWNKKSKSSSNRGLVDDGADVPAAQRKTAITKTCILELMLGQIANFCPVIARNEIIKKSTSLPQIWQVIRLHYGFQSSGAQFLDFADFKLHAEEKHEDLYQRIVAFVEDNLLTKDGNITHHNETIDEDEEVTPSLENFIIVVWLRLIHKDLPHLIKQRYGTELRSRTLASIKPEISQGLPSLLEEIRCNEDAKVLRTFTHTSASNKLRPKQSKGFPAIRKGRSFKSCPLCKQADRREDHFLSECKFLPDSDRKYMTKARQMFGIRDDSSEDEDEIETAYESECQDKLAYRIQVQQSPYLDAVYRHFHVRVTIVSGATCNMIRASLVKRLAIPMSKSSQSALQADESSPLVVVGETHFTISHGSQEFTMESLVVENLDVDILAGTPFMEQNDVSIRPAKRQVILSNGEIVYYGSVNPSNEKHSIRRANVLRTTNSTTVWPGDYLEVEVSEDAQMYALEPRVHNNTVAESKMWPEPDSVSCVARKVRIPNFTKEPQVLKSNNQYGQLHHTLTAAQEYFGTENSTSHPKCIKIVKGDTTVPSPQVQLDPDSILTSEMSDKFTVIQEQYKDVFNPHFKGYNKAADPSEAVVNMGPTKPPQRKGGVPQYNRDKLQDKFDELEKCGTFARLEDIGVCVEYSNPSFVIKKKSGGYRLVTAFADVGRYSKPQPSLLPDVDGTLCQISHWQYIISSDLTKAFYQIPLAKKSVKCCGVATPVKDVRVYTRSAMGMPGSETALEELMCRILGDLLHKGYVAKLADSTPASCSKPATVTNMRSYIGAYKVLSQVIPRCASLIGPLDNAITGLQATAKISWDDELSSAFQSSQKALKSTQTITLPKSEDQLWVINTRIRSRGLSAREVWVQRVQFTNDHIPSKDQDMIREQHSQRLGNHEYSAKSKVPSMKFNPHKKK